MATPQLSPFPPCARGAVARPPFRPRAARAASAQRLPPGAHADRYGIEERWRGLWSGRPSAPARSRSRERSEPSAASASGRKCSSYCGNGISMPSSRNAARIAKCSVVVISSRRSGSAIQACSSRSERRLPEAHEVHVGRRVLEHLGTSCRDAEQHLPHVLDVGPVRHADRQAQAQLRIAVRPVHDPTRDELGVGHDDRDVVAGHDLRRAHVDRPDVTVDVTDGHLITHGDGTLDQQDEARDEVAREVLEAESDAHAQDARHDGQPGEVDVRAVSSAKRSASARTA